MQMLKMLKREEGPWPPGPPARAVIVEVGREM